MKQQDDGLAVRRVADVADVEQELSEVDPHVGLRVTDQDLNQLKALYKERWESFLANAGVVQGFTPNDLTTADWMSRRAGQATMLAPSSSESRSPKGERGESTSWSQIGRQLYLPQELMGFAEGTGLLWLAGMANGVRFFAPPYWKIEQAAKRAGRNPYYEG